MTKTNQPFKVTPRRSESDTLKSLENMLDADDVVRLNVAIPKKMHTELKIRCAQERKKIKAVVRELLQDYLNK